MCAVPMSKCICRLSTGRYVTYSDLFLCFGKEKAEVMCIAAEQRTQIRHWMQNIRVYVYLACDLVTCSSSERSVTVFLRVAVFDGCLSSESLADISSSLYLGSVHWVASSDVVRRFAFGFGKLLAAMKSSIACAFCRGSCRRHRK